MRPIAWLLRRLPGWLVGVLALPVYVVSIHLNALGVFAPSEFDRGDTGNPTIADWGEGRRDLFGLGGEHARRNLADLRRKGWSGHNLRSFGYSWMEDYVKRGTRVSSLAFVVALWGGALGWIV